MLLIKTARSEGYYAALAALGLSPLLKSASFGSMAMGLGSRMLGAATNFLGRGAAGGVRQALGNKIMGAAANMGAPQLATAVGAGTMAAGAGLGAGYMMGRNTGVKQGSAGHADVLKDVLTAGLVGVVPGAIGGAIGADENERLQGALRGALIGGALGTGIRAATHGLGMAQGVNPTDILNDLDSVARGSGNANLLIKGPRADVHRQHLMAALAAPLVAGSVPFVTEFSHRTD